MNPETKLESFSITPLGAAYVDALPDQSKASNILQEFHSMGITPVSKTFPTFESIRDYYDRHPDARPRVVRIEGKGMKA